MFLSRAMVTSDENFTFLAYVENANLLKGQTMRAKTFLGPIRRAWPADQTFPT